MDSAQLSVGSTSRTQEDLDYQQMFDAYLYEYLLQRNLVASAEIFKQEAQIGDLKDKLLTDSPGDFLFDWWTIFFESYTSRLNGPQGIHTSLLPQFGQGSSTYELPPFSAFLQDPVARPLVHATDYIPQPWPTSDVSSLPYGAGGIRQAWSVPDGPQLITSAGNLLPVRWTREGAYALANEHASMPYIDNLSFQSPGNSAAVVLTPRNLNSNIPGQFPEPIPPRMGIRHGSNPNDPIDVEAPMPSSASVPRGHNSSASKGRKPRRHSQTISRRINYSTVPDSSLLGAIRMPAAMPTSSSGPRSMSQLLMAGQMAHYSIPRPFPAQRAVSAFSLMANSNASSGSLVSSNLGVGDQVESYGSFSSNYFASNQNSSAQKSADELSSKPLITGAMGVSVAMNPSISTQEMCTEKNCDGAKTETLGRPSTPGTVSNPQSDAEMKNNEDVNTCVKDTIMKEADEDGEEQRGNDSDVGVYLNDENCPEDVTDTNAVAPAP